MPIVDASGTAAGAGDLVPMNPIKWVIVTGALLGAGATSTNFGVIYLVSGTASGTGTLSDPFLILPGLNPAVGSGTTTANQVVVIHNVSAQFLGGGRVSITGQPDPVHGMGDTSAHLVATTMRPVFPPTWCGTPKFSWGQSLTIGDLPLYLIDTSGNPYAPYLVNYTIYWIRPGGYAQQIGAGNRTPIMADIGVFYATGTTGDAGGQPGLWRITWRWQSNAGGPFECYSYDFRVLDAVLRHDPRDTTPRVKKYGWGPA